MNTPLPIVACIIKVSVTSPGRWHVKGLIACNTRSVTVEMWRVILHITLLLPRPWHNDGLQSVTNTTGYIRGYDIVKIRIILFTGLSYNSRSHALSF